MSAITGCRQIRFHGAQSPRKVFLGKPHLVVVVGLLKSMALILSFNGATSKRIGPCIKQQHGVQTEASRSRRDKRKSHKGITAKQDVAMATILDCHKRK